jgi:hypothetical protein
MKKSIRSSFLILIAIICFVQVSHAGNSVFTTRQHDDSSTKQVNDSITFKTYKTDAGWGYDIYINEKIYVHQPNIPAVSGSKGFDKEKYAKKTAHLVIEKIRKHILPPTVATDELKSLKVLK